MPLLDRIKFDGRSNNKSWLVYKAGIENIALGSQLIVGPGQEAIFVKGGRAQDIFTSGTYTLQTGNLPLLRNLVGRAFGGHTPFTAEIVFINKTNNFTVKWGTNSPILTEDPKYGIHLGLRAFGSFAVKVENTRNFINQLVGTVQLNSGFNHDIVWQKFSSLINTKLKSQLLKFMLEKGISFLEIAAYYDKVSKLTFEELKQDFKDCGLELVNFLLESATPPDEERELLRKRKEELALGEGVHNREVTLEILRKTNNTEMGKIIANSIWNASSTSTQNGNRDDNSRTSTQITCPACHKVVEAGSRFCRFCGNEFPQQKFCSNCGKSLEPDARFCSNCGRACD